MTVRVNSLPVLLTHLFSLSLSPSPLISVGHWLCDNLLVWYSEDGSPVIKAGALPPEVFVLGCEQRSYRRLPWRIVGEGGEAGDATAGPVGRLQIHLSQNRRCGVLTVLLVLHFNLQSGICRGSVRDEREKWKILILLSVKMRGKKTCGWESWHTGSRVKTVQKKAKL